MVRLVAGMRHTTRDEYIREQEENITSPLFFTSTATYLSSMMS